jgi:hypothetical protein
MNRLVTAGLLLACTLAIGACSTAKVNTDWDRRVDLGQYRTFEFEPSTKGTESIARAAVAVAAGEELEAAGLRRDNNNPDLLVGAFGSINETVRFENYAVSYAPYGGWGFWYGHGWEGTAIAARAVSAGTIVVDLIDAGTNELVWRGMATGTIEDDDSPDRIKAGIDRAVQRMFSGFPPKQVPPPAE